MRYIIYCAELLIVSTIDLIFEFLHILSNLSSFRKKEVKFDFDDVETQDVSLEVEQISHLFPFGQAVYSPELANCHDQDSSSNYCEYVSQNFNWIVDTYRMKWRPIEPSRGDFEVEIPTKMISWAGQNNISVRGG